MMKRRPVIILILTLTFGGSGIYFTQRSINAEMGLHRQTEEALYLPSGEMIKRLSFGVEAVVADLYWLRTVQYYGQRAFRPGQRLELLDPLLDIITTLDPHFIVAYQFGAVFLALPPPGGPGQPEKAIALLSRGIEHNPESWRLQVDKGFVYAWDLHEYQKAAEVFEQASRLPKAPSWLAAVAAGMYTKAGRREAARRIWQDRYENAENERLREIAARQLAALRALDMIEQLEALIAKYHQRVGRMPHSWQELIAAGLLRRVPVDPYGFVYQLDSETGTVRPAPGTPLVLPRL